MTELVKLDGSDQLAVTERGTRIEKYTEADVNLALRLLAVSGGKVKAVCAQLLEESIVIEPSALVYWRDTAFARRYYELRQELARDIGEDIAGKAFERALQADDAQEQFIAKAVEKIEEIPAKDLPKAAQAMAQSKSIDIEKSQLLRDRPTQIKETRDPAELLEVLRKAGVLRQASVDELPPAA